MKSQARDFWEELILKDTSLHIIHTLTYTGGEGHRGTSVLFHFFEDNLQIIHLKIEHCRKWIAFKRFTFNSAVRNAYNQDRLQTIDPLTNPLSAETQTWRSSFGNICHA